MSARTVIDGLEFSRTEDELKGHLPLADLNRLRDCLFDAVGGVDFLLKGDRDRQRRFVLHLEVRGVLQLQCQRCLQALAYPLQITNTLLLVRPNEPFPVEADEPDAPDCIVAEADMDVATLIEDEILLSLPLSPRHPEGTCNRQTSAGSSGPAASPFASLASLRR
jgi:uncharacterized protein